MIATTSTQQRRSIGLRIAILAVLSGSVTSTTAWAQDVVIVGGDASVLGHPSSIPQWNVVGTGISVFAGGGDSGSPGGARCTPCVAGTTVGMAGVFAGSSLGSGPAIVNGVRYDNVFFGGSISFHANTAVMPEFDGNSWTNVTVPFNLGTGSFLTGYADQTRTMVLFSVRLFGQGTVTLHLKQDGASGRRFYDFASVTYTFGPGLNLLQKPGFEEYTPPALGVPGWVSDRIRQTPAYSETNQPHSGAQHGTCSTPDSLDCGIYQDVTAPSTGTYTLIFYATADRAGGLVGADVNGLLAVSSPVEARGFRNYGTPYTMTFPATAGDTIHVWMYSPAIPGYVVIDDVSLVGPQ